jgi:hypothetical protein
MWCAVSTLGLVLAMPNNPKDKHPVLVTQLQDFAWTESLLEQMIQVRLEMPAVATLAVWLVVI